MDPQFFNTIAAIVVILGGIFSALKWGKGAARRVSNLLVRDRTGVPRDTMRIVPKPTGTWWHMGARGNDPAMQVASHWYVTNITDDELRILGARIPRPHAEGHVAVEHPERRIFGDYPILPGATSEVIVDLWVEPPVRQAGQEFKATLVLIDQFGNEHKIKKVVFKYK